MGLRIRIVFVAVLLSFFLTGVCAAGLVYQDFEEGNGSGTYGWGFNSAVTEFSAGEEPVYSGARSWKITSPGDWGGTGIASQVQTWDMDFEPDRHDRLVFWVYALPEETSESLDNGVAVKFFDREDYRSSGFEVWTSKAAKYGEWTQLSVLFSQLPDGFNLNRIDKIEFVNENPGTYYLDDIHVVSADRTYQSFEPILYDPYFTGEEYEKYGWAWFGIVDLFVDDQIVQEGQQSWMLDTHDLMGGTGVKSQEKKFVDNEQSPWYVDLLGVRDPLLPEDSPYDRVTFWVYSLAENGLDNNIGMQFFDHNYWVEDLENPEERNPFILWTEGTADYGEWKRFTVKFDELHSGDPAEPPVDLQNLNKIQFQVYWRGRYFFDDIRATKPFPEIDRISLKDGTAEWNTIAGADIYVLQQSSAGANGPWETIYEGPSTNVPVSRVSQVWLRVAWKEAVDPASNPVPYMSDWSDVASYTPAPVLISKDALKQGTLQWSDLPQATQYEVEMASSKRGPWIPVYNGPYTTLAAATGIWYRARALIEDSGAVVDTGEWSPAQTYTPGTGYIKAVGKILKEEDGTGDNIILRGVNLGNYLLIEPWMTGITLDTNQRTEDDWNIREELIQRFGAQEADRLLGIYQDAYITETDLNHILRSGANLIRLPIYYRALRELDENTGEWVAGTDYNFDKIDAVVNLCADRGIYVLLDLHGAPGAQSKEFHSGRTSAESPGQGFYHKLFDPTDDTYRQRTTELWQALADYYKDNTTVVGYDLLNEPFGAVDAYYYANYHDGLTALWTLYDQLYDAIRAIDPHHLIVMEAIPSDKDWETLPDPDGYGWTNVMYQFHYYGFKLDENGSINGVLDADQQKAYLVSGNDPECAVYPDDDKFCGKVFYSQQDEYDVPVLIGEFNGFDQREVWDLFLTTFNKQAWNWTMWSYKHHPKRESWGLYTHVNYDEDAPNVSLDDTATLETKLAKYDTFVHHEPNVTLNKVLKNYLTQQTLVTQPALAGRTADEVNHRWSSVDFADRFKKKPVLVAGIETYNGPNTAGLRIKSLNKGRFKVKIEEEQSGDPETIHTTEVVSYLALEPGIVLDDTGTVIGEAGSVTAYQRNGAQWHTVTLEQEYSNPVVLMQMTTYHGRQPSHIRLRNVSGHSFEYQIEEWDYLDQWHLTEKISYVVLEQGVHTLTNGQTIDVGTVDTDENWITVPYAASFNAAPATISHCQTYNAGQAVITREQNVSNSSFEVKLQEEEGGAGPHPVETIGYIAVEL